MSASKERNTSPEQRRRDFNRSNLRVGGIVAGVVLGSYLFGVIGAVSCGIVGGFIAHRLGEEIWKD